MIRKDQIDLITMHDFVQYSSNSKLTNQLKKLPSESDDLSTYNIFNIIASVCNSFVSKICDFLPTVSLPTFATANSPCNCDECINYIDQIENDIIKLSLLYDRKIFEDLELVKYKNDSCKPYYARNYSINQAKSITYVPWQQMAGNPAYGDGGQIDLRRLSRLGVPIDNYFQDLHSTSVENYQFLNQGNHLDVYDPICDKMFYLCGQCECEYKSQLEWRSRNNLEPQTCKCSLCECLSCPLQKEASFAEKSTKSLKTNVMHNSIQNQWKNRLPNNKQIQACKSPNIYRNFRESTKMTVGKFNKEKSSVKCSKQGHNRKRWQCTQKDSTFNNDYTYKSDYEMEENNKNASTVNTNKMLTDQLIQNMYVEHTVMNHAINTENFTTDRCTETVNIFPNKKSFTDNRVKNYAYTLKIEIIAPNFDDNMKQDMEQRTKEASKNKIMEHTQKVMRYVTKDISNNSLLQEMLGSEKPSALQPLDSENPGDMGSQEQNKTHNILEKTSTVSLKSTATENQNSSDMVTALARSNVSKMEDFIVGCVTPLNKASRRTVKEIGAKMSQLPSRDESVLSQSWSPVPPAHLMSRTQVDVTEKLISCVGSVADMNKSGKCLDDLKVREPCLRRVSNHTVSLKWKQPLLIEEIMGYDILVDGKIIEKIVNPKRCLAVVSCLPPVRRLMITIRTLPKTPNLRGLYPCTTIGYQPRANKCVRIA